MRCWRWERMFTWTAFILITCILNKLTVFLRIKRQSYFPPFYAEYAFVIALPQDLFFVFYWRPWQVVVAEGHSIAAQNVYRYIEWDREKAGIEICKLQCCHKTFCLWNRCAGKRPGGERGINLLKTHLAGHSYKGPQPWILNCWWGTEGELMFNNYSDNMRKMHCWNQVHWPIYSELKIHLPFYISFYLQYYSWPFPINFWPWLCNLPKVTQITEHCAEKYWEWSELDGIIIYQVLRYSQNQF